MQHASVEDYTIALSESNIWLSMQSIGQFNATVDKLKSTMIIVLHYSNFCNVTRPGYATIQCFKGSYSMTGSRKC